MRWAIERYRKERQAPLLTRAAQLFATLTLKEFDRLDVDYDADDRSHLVAVRANGARVEVDGLSAGTVDQLYLALRIAAIEAYLEKAAPLPFIADDLLVNYDDPRAAAGVKVLYELATQTQVLFLTHHEHLVQLAKESLRPNDVPVIELGDNC